MKKEVDKFIWRAKKNTDLHMFEECALVYLNSFNAAVSTTDYIAVNDLMMVKNELEGFVEGSVVLA